MQKLFLCALVLLSACLPQNITPSLIGAAAPPARFTLMDGSYHSLAELADRPILIVFWSEECGHCRAEIPEINPRLKELMQTKRAWVLAINLEPTDKLAKVQEYITQVGFDGALHAFSGNESLDETFIAFQGSTTPYYVLIDSNGQVQYADGDFERALNLLSQNPT